MGRSKTKLVEEATFPAVLRILKRSFNYIINSTIFVGFTNHCLNKLPRLGKFVNVSSLAITLDDKR